MNPTRWQKIKMLFSGILELPVSEQRAAVEHEEDAEIRAELEKLLAAHDHLDGFIDRPILIERGLANDDPYDIVAGKEIDHYLILDRIGAGGMGTVYLAERINSDFTQKVALKIVKRGMDSEEILKRFAAERRILSRLNHPNIAQLFDGGISGDGLPFFVMEFVDGKPLKTFFLENETEIRTRLEIFRQICAAVDYAHKNLIVHRDLKPSNILINNDGVPKLLDFGIAKVLSDEDPAVTATQLKIFTPEYASPEQISGGFVTTATDIYSLGVILYELLTGFRPFDTTGKSYDEIRRNVCETEPRRPSERLSNPHLRTFDAARTDRNSAETDGEPGRSLAEAGNQKNVRLLRGDLDNIVLKALRKDPAERYDSIFQFSADIDRYLNALPVLARPQTVSYKLEKFVKRHKAGVFAAVMVFVSLVGGTSVATWQAVVARRERARADQRFQDVRQLANTILFDHYERIKQLPGATEAREKLVSDALVYLDKIAAESADDKGLQGELVQAYKRLGDIQGSTGDGGNLGEISKSRDNYLKALTIQEKIASSGNSTIEDRRTLGTLYFEINSLFDGQNEREIRAGFVEKGLNIYTALEVENPNLVQRQADLARALWYHANSVRLMGDNPGAIEVYGKSAAIYESLSAGTENPHKYKRSAALTYRNIGGIYELMGSYQTSLEYYEKALSHDRETADLFPNNAESLMDLSFTQKSLGNIFLKLGDYEKALEHMQGSIGLLEKVVGLDPKNDFAETSLFGVYSGTAETFSKNGDFESAEIFFQKGNQILQTRTKEKTDSFSIAIANHLWSYGNFLMKRSDAKKDRARKILDIKTAQKHFRDALDIYETLEKSKRLDPAYLPNLPKISESLGKAENELSVITKR